MPGILISPPRARGVIPVIRRKKPKLTDGSEVMELGAGGGKTPPWLQFKAEKRRNIPNLSFSYLVSSACKRSDGEGQRKSTL